MGGGCSTHGRGEKFIKNIGQKSGREETMWKMGG